MMKPELVQKIVLIFAGVTILGLDLFSPRGLVYDERFYVVDAIPILDEYGFGKKFLEEYPHPAGISFGLLNWILKPITGLNPRAVRLINPFFGILIVLLLGDLLKRDNYSSAWTQAGSILILPYYWVITGLALTEMIGVACALAGFYAWRRVAEDIRIPSWSYLASSIGGVFVGLAFFSRPPLLAVCAVVPLYVYMRPKLMVSGALFVFAVACTVLPVIAIWGGIVPPKVNFYDSTKFSVSNMLLSLGYCGIGVSLLAPAWINLGRKYLLLMFTCGAGVNMVIGMVSITAMMTVALKLLPESAIPFYSRAIGSIFVGIAAIFVSCTMSKITSSKASISELASIVIAVILVISVGKITHQFSSRYTSIAAPFIILAVAPYVYLTWYQVLRTVIGVVLGALSLLSYLVM